jgi:hypothetical protein
VEVSSCDLTQVISGIRLEEERKHTETLASTAADPAEIRN